jgi:hypothetical protein
MCMPCVFVSKIPTPRLQHVTISAFRIVHQPTTAIVTTSMAKLLRDDGSFLPFTHQDNFPSLESLEVVDNANEDLARLLRLQFPDFVEALVDTRVAAFINSFLCYKLRRADKVVLCIKPEAGADMSRALLVKFRQVCARAPSFSCHTPCELAHVGSGS